MAANVAPPKNTGGGGFVFENDVCAWLLASMLVGEPVFGVGYGPPVRLDFQASPDKWFLDDVLVTTSVGSVRHRFALSVKSNAQFTATSAPSDFVAAAWEQWLHVGSAVFDASRDFMGLVTAPLSGAAAQSASGLLEKARVNDPAIFPERLAEPNWANENERALFDSFASPASLDRETTAMDTARLLQRLRFVQCDFGAVASESENSALELCRRAVRSHVVNDAQALWNILRELASELRPRAGSVTQSGLIERLRARVMLADYPDHAGDWETLDARSAREAALVRDSIAGRIRLPREDRVAEVLGSISNNVQIALLGPSGVGKSAIAKAVFERRRTKGDRTLWVDASSLDRAADFGAFEATLQLRQPLAELLGTEVGREPVVVIDGIDRLYSEHALRNVASLLQLVGRDPPSTRWRVIAVCQSQEWSRVLDALQRAGASASQWKQLQVGALRLSDLNPVQEDVPTLRRLLSQPRVGTLLTNLKLLDLVVRRLDAGANVDASEWVGESSVAEWFWTSEIDRGADRFARGKFARALAQEQADQLAASVPVDALDAGVLDAAQSLTADQLLVQVPGDRLTFAHDLYGDWARLRILLNHRSNLATFLRGRHESPLWHRAIRLLGIHLLERENGVTEWKTLMSLFANGEMIIVRDLLLEAPAFAMNAGPLLERVFQDLVAGDEGLLRRLLTRFLAFATVPNEAMVTAAQSLGVDVHSARAAYRRPYGACWLDVLAVLHSHRDDALRVAAPEVAKLVEMWLELVPPGLIRRSEASALAVMLGRIALDSRDDYRSREDRRRFYKCALLAAPERPDEVAEIAKTAAERVPRPAVTPPDVVAPPLPHPPLGSLFSTGIMRGPWPDGPLVRVDDEFQSVVLDGSSIQPLYRARPALVREVILATLIRAPYEERLGSGGMRDRDLDLVSRHEWHPSLFTQGPFAPCLRENFEEGLELIMRLVEFATDRSIECYGTREVNAWRVQAAADGYSEAEIDQAAKHVPSQRLVLHDGTQEIYFSGDAGTYGWSAGVTCPQGYSPLPPPAVASALMALEQYFYQRLDAGEDVIADVTTTLARCRSVAPLGVLIDVGKREASLFDGPLRPLLSAPEIYSWEISKMVSAHDRTHLMIGALDHGRWFVEAARKFHGLEHRKHDLRRVATACLLLSAEMQTFFATIRAWWEKRRADGEALGDMADRLDLWFDLENYETHEDPTEGALLVNVALARMQSEQSDARHAMSDLMLVTNFPIRCRRVLDERSLQTDAELEELWKSWQRIRELAKAGPALPGGAERLGNEYVNAITGGVALFLWHAEWLSRHATRREELESALVTAIEAPREQAEFADEHDVSTWTWDCFFAEAAAMLWAREPQDVRWRELVAGAVFSRKYAALRLLFSRCAEHRVTLGEDFGRLRRLAVDGAHVRDLIDAIHGWQHMAPQGGERVLEQLQEKIATWSEEAIAAFIRGALEPLPVDWNNFREASRFTEAAQFLRRFPDRGFIDFHAVRCSHEWLPLPDEALSSEERADVVQFWRVALDVVAARPRASVRKRDHLYPDEDERWVLDKIAAVVLQLRPEERAEQLWTPIIDLHDDAHHWPEIFLNALHRCALTLEETPVMYGPLVRQIVHHAFSGAEDSQRWSRHEAVWDALIGLDGYTRELWTDRHSQHVAALWDVVSMWMERVPLEGRRLGKFARWLAVPAVAAVRLRTLSWFLERLRTDERRAWYRDEDFADGLARLLNVVWEHDLPRLREVDEASGAFRGLLTWLVERQNALALELQGRIGGLN